MLRIVLFGLLCGCMPHYDIPPVEPPPEYIPMAKVVPTVQSFIYVTAPSVHKQGNDVCMSGEDFLARDNALYGCTESLQTASSNIRAVVVQRDYYNAVTDEYKAYDSKLSEQYEVLAKEYVSLEAANKRQAFMYKTALGVVVGLVVFKALKP